MGRSVGSDGRAQRVRGKVSVDSKASRWRSRATCIMRPMTHGGDDRLDRAISAGGHLVLWRRAASVYEGLRGALGVASDDVFFSHHAGMSV